MLAQWYHVLSGLNHILTKENADVLSLFMLRFHIPYFLLNHLGSS